MSKTGLLKMPSLLWTRGQILSAVFHKGSLEQNGLTSFETFWMLYVTLRENPTDASAQCSET